MIKKCQGNNLEKELYKKARVKEIHVNILIYHR